MGSPGSDAVFAGSIPELYDTHLVPLLFEPYAVDLARRVAALASLFPADPPRFMARTPHGYFDPPVIWDDLAKAGFGAAPRFETLTARSRAPSARVAALAFCQGTPMRSELEARAGADLARVTSACAAALAERFGEGPIEGRMRAHVVSVQR